MAIVRSIGFLQLDDFFPLNLVIHSYDGFTASRDQLSPIVVVVQTVELLVDGSRVVFDGRQQFSRVEVPVLDLPFCVCSGENVSGLEVVVFGSP